MLLNVEGIKSISFPHEVSSRRPVITGDHRLPGDRRSLKADFDRAKAEKLMAFQREIVKGDLHIINGDVFEGWQFELDDILKENRDILDLLLSSNVIFNIGNHDKGALREWINKKRVPLDTEWTSGRKRVVARHGHAVDPLDNDDASWFEEFITRVGGVFGMPGVQLDDCYDWVMNFKKKTPCQVDNEAFTRQESIYVSFAKMLIEKYDCDCVLMGDTHRASLEERMINGRKRVLANTGSWIKGKYKRDMDDTFIEIEGKEVRHKPGIRSTTLAICTPRP